MNKHEAEKEIKRLSREIEEHNYRYYVLSQPTISDKEYDDLLNKLIKLEAEFPDLKDINSPSQRVGVKMEAATQAIRHRTKMYSLDNTYSFDELAEWKERVEKALKGQDIDYVVELKIDGVSASLTYENGKLVLGATRGDGLMGEDVTHALKTVR